LKTELNKSKANLQQFNQSKYIINSDSSVGTEA